MTVDFHGMNVLVTGGAGFVGSHTVDALIDCGAHVTVVDNLSTGRPENLNPRASFHPLNIAAEAMEGVLRDVHPAIIYHFAHYVLVPKSVENPLLDLDAIAGSLRILRAARDIGIRKIIYASSGFVYGNARELPAREETPIDPVSPYVVSKAAIEHYLRFFRDAFGVPSVVLRYSAVYGPRQITGAMADYIRKLSSGQQAEMWGNGTKTRDYVYVADVVRANLEAVQVPADHPDPTFNIGTSIETSLNDLYQKIAKLLGVKADPIYHPDRPGEQMRYALDFSKARRELGWSPQYSVDEGLRLLLRSIIRA